MKKLTTTFVVILITIFSCGQSETTEKLNEDNYSIEYPSSWELDTSGKLNTKFLIFSEAGVVDDFRENVNLSIQNLPNNVTMEAFKQGTEQQLPQIPKSKIVSSKIVKINNVDVLEIIWQGFVTNNDLKFKQRCYLKDNKAHILTFTAKQSTYDQYEAAATKILNSFILK